MIDASSSHAALLSEIESLLDAFEANEAISWDSSLTTAVKGGHSPAAILSSELSRTTEAVTPLHLDGTTNNGDAAAAAASVSDRHARVTARICTVLNRNRELKAELSRFKLAAATAHTASNTAPATAAAAAAPPSTNLHSHTNQPHRIDLQNHLNSNHSLAGVHSVNLSNHHMSVSSPALDSITECRESDASVDSVGLTSYDDSGSISTSDGNDDSGCNSSNSSSNNSSDESSLDVQSSPFSVSIDDDVDDVLSDNNIPSLNIDRRGISPDASLFAPQDSPMTGASILATMPSSLGRTHVNSGVSNGLFDGLATLGSAAGSLHQRTPSAVSCSSATGGNDALHFAMSEPYTLSVAEYECLVRCINAIGDIIKGNLSVRVQPPSALTPSLATPSGTTTTTTTAQILSDLGIVSRTASVASGQAGNNPTRRNSRASSAADTPLPPAQSPVEALCTSLNDMVSRLDTFTNSVTKLTNDLGVEGKLGVRVPSQPKMQGRWMTFIDAFNAMSSSHTLQIRDISDVCAAVARGDLSRRVIVPVRGEKLVLKNTINTMVDQLISFSYEVNRVAHEVGTEGTLGGQVHVKEVGGTWKDICDNVNRMAYNVTAQVRDIANVCGAVSRGDLTKEVTVAVRGEVLWLKNTINDMVSKLAIFASEVTRVAKEVGTEGILGGQATVDDVEGTWKDLTDSVNLMASNLTNQVRNISSVTKAVAQGDLSKKVEVTVKGEVLDLKNTINSMVDQLQTFASEVTRVAKEVGTEGILGGQANVDSVDGTWKDLTDSVNLMATNLTNQVRDIATVTTAVARGDLSKKVEVSVKGEVLELKNTINSMVEQLQTFATEVTRVAKEVGTEGILGGQATVENVDGTWKDLTDSVNLMATNLTNQVRDIATVTTAVAKGDLSRKVEVVVRGEVLELKNTINSMVDQLQTFASEVIRVAKDVGTKGILGGQAEVHNVAGTWRDLTDNVNLMASNLTKQVRDIANVTKAVAAGDLSLMVTVDVQGEIHDLKMTVNSMVSQLNTFASEVIRVAKEVGTEGKLGGQATVEGVDGTWKALTDNVNLMALNLTNQVRDIATVTTAVAKGDLSRKVTVDVKGEIHDLKMTVNSMVSQLQTFASEVSRVAYEVGTEGRLGGQATVEGVDGTWKDLTDNVNQMASNLTNQVRNISSVTKAVARGDLSKKVEVAVKGEVLELKNTINSMVEQLQTFASEVTRVAKEVGTDGILGGQATVDNVDGTWKDLTDNVNQMATNLTNQVRDIATVTTAVARGDLSRKVEVAVRGEVLELKNTINSMVDQLQTFASEVSRVAYEVGTEGRLGGQATVEGVDGTWKDLTDNVNQMASNLTNQVRNISSVTKAVARGDLSKKVEVAVKGEVLELKNTINSMVEQLQTFASEVTRVAKEVGTDGILGGQATVDNVDGTWKDLTDNVNQMATNLTNQVRDIATVTTAVARGDLSQKVEVAVKGEIHDLKMTVNSMVDQLRDFAAEVTRVAKEVGTEGILGGQATVDNVDGTWKDLTDSVNLMATNLTNQVRSIATVTVAVASGDLSRKVEVDVKGEMLDLKNTINSMVDQLQNFASEVTRVAKEVGTEGILGGQATVKDVDGVWKSLTDSVNLMATNLTNQVRNISDVTKAVARGDLSTKVEVDVKGEVLELKNTINSMVDQLNNFAAEVTRVAKEVGTEGKLGGQAEVHNVDGTWKALTDSVNLMATNLTNQVRNISDVTKAVARGDLSTKVEVDVKGEVLELKNTINSMVDQLNTFAAEVTRVAKEVGTEGKLGGQAEVHNVDGTWKDLTDNVNQMAKNLTNQVRDIANVTKAVAAGDLSLMVTVDVQGEIHDLKMTVNSMVDQLNTFASEVIRVAKEVGTEGILGGQATVKGVAGTWKALTDNVNLMALNLTNQVRDIANVTKAVAKGDLSRKVTVEVQGEVLELKNTINSMVSQLQTFASEVTRVAYEVGTEGKLGGQATVAGVDGTWRDLTENVNQMASNLTTQVRAFSQISAAATAGDLTSYINVQASGDMGSLKAEINQMITNLRETMQRNIVAREAAELANRAKSEFLANMSHEIRTPMNGIIGMTNSTLETELTRHQRENLLIAQSQATQLMLILNDILDISKIEAGRLILEKEDFTPRQLVFNLLKNLAVKATQKNLDLVFDVDINVPTLLVGDSQRVRQVMTNLVGNAIKFTSQGQVSLSIYMNRRWIPRIQNAAQIAHDFMGRDADNFNPTTPINHPSNWSFIDANGEQQVILEICVSDTGIGIESDKVEIIFDMFSQADGSTTRKYGGTGLGLSISKRFVGLMGGEIWVESEIGKGSKFFFTVVVQPGVMTEAMAFKKLERFKSGNILLFDSDPSECDPYEVTSNDYGVLIGGEPPKLYHDLTPLSEDAPDLSSPLSTPSQSVASRSPASGSTSMFSRAISGNGANNSNSGDDKQASSRRLLAPAVPLHQGEQPNPTFSKSDMLLKFLDELNFTGYLVRSIREVDALCNNTANSNSLTFVCIIATNDESVRRVRSIDRLRYVPIIMFTRHPRPGSNRRFVIRHIIDLGMQSIFDTPRTLFDLATALEPGLESFVNMSVQPGKSDPHLHILLAEDNTVNQKLAVRILQQHQNSVTVVQNGKEALECIIAGRYFDMILMDVQMPIMGGYEATQKIREWERRNIHIDDRHIPIVAVTAHAMKGDREKSLAAGMDEYITKPLRADALMQLIRQFYEKGRLRTRPKEKIPRELAF
ncbi:hypothetical protein GQ42DRAFT_162570 [Ramicandelaber brevisporus]|nr:hypothetical protein GQ42DRAFT_162570 [Ramicandelaber brevisporus]